jgi:hypothetical protein
LELGGTIARFWTTTVLSEPAIAAFEPIYRQHAPEVTQVWRPSESTPRFHASRRDPFARSEAFSSTAMRTYPWERRVRTDEWLGLAATISDHQRLGRERLQALLQALRIAIDELGGTVQSHNETYALLNRRI